jgi:hypothetical protein
MHTFSQDHGMIRGIRDDLERCLLAPYGYSLSLARLTDALVEEEISVECPRAVVTVQAPALRLANPGFVRTMASKIPAAS